MVGGFRESPLRLNASLGLLENWDEAGILARGDRLAAQAMTLWPVPQAPESAMEVVRRRLRDNRRGFDWRTTHRILEALPAGRWTTYAALAEAVGTAPQPLASHVSG